MGRVDPIPPDEWPPEMADAIVALRPPNPRYPLPSRDPSRPKGLNALGLFAHHPELATAYHHFNGHVLFASTISPRQRELLVLRVAVLRDTAYEWAQHAVLAGDAGITHAELEDIRSGPGTGSWSAFEAALLMAADELVRDACLSEGTWTTLAAELDTQQLMDVVFTVGAYDLLAMAFRTFGVELDDDLSNRASGAS
jgi:alkylhydroperoxidase family enzyme